MLKTFLWINLLDLEFKNNPPKTHHDLKQIENAENFSPIRRSLSSIFRDLIVIELVEMAFDSKRKIRLLFFEQARRK